MIDYNSIKFIVLVVQKCRSYCECNIRALFAFSEKFVYRREGYRVEAVELVERNIQIFRNKLKEGEDIRIFQGNAMELSCFADESMDVTLLLGPMYHLFSEKHKKKALAEAVREALRQIEEKNYQANLVAKGIPEERIRKYAFAFCGKKF